MLVAALALDLLALALEVAGVLHLHLDLCGDVVALHRRPQFGDGGEHGVIEFGPAQQVDGAGLAADRDAELALDRRAARVRRGHPQRAEALQLALDRVALGAQCVEARLRHHAEFETLLGEAQVGIVLAQQQPVLGARR